MWRTRSTEQYNPGRKCRRPPRRPIEQGVSIMSRLTLAGLFWVALLLSPCSSGPKETPHTPSRPADPQGDPPRYALRITITGESLSINDKQVVLPTTLDVLEKVLGKPD